jgi:predicted dehydrogenase
MLKIGMIGAGFVAGFHERALCSVRGVELAGVCAENGAEALVKRANDDGLGPAQVYRSIKALCQAVDVICIFVPNFARIVVMQAIADAVKAGAELKGIICDKPLARNLIEADQMVTLAKETEVPTAYFENQLHMPGVINARKQLEAVFDKCGQPHLSRSAEEHGGPHEPWFWDPTQQGGGVWCDMGCHSAAAGQWMLTPPGKPANYLTPISVTATMELRKWRRQPWLQQLKDKGVDYTQNAAEDYANVTIKFLDPETGVISTAQATDSWCYDAPGLRLLMELYGCGYNYVVNSLVSPTTIFISDAAAIAAADSELALEKAQASRGSIVLMDNEPDTYGYINEWRDALAAFEAGRDALVTFDYGRLVAMLVMAGYYAHEKGKTIDLTDTAVQTILNTYIPAIQAGHGADVLGEVKA